MTQPLALVQYVKLLPGSQLVNRLQDMGYRVQALTDPATLVEHARREKPLVVMVDCASHQVEVHAAIARLRQDPDTRHLPVIALADAKDPPSQESARTAGATLVVNDTAILTHLENFLEQALRVD